MKNYKVKQEDLIGDLEGFPIEVVQAMVIEQERQGYEANVSVFQRDKTSGLTPKGFVWYKTKEKSHFWSEVIADKNFDLFFEKYPKKDPTEVIENAIALLKSEGYKILKPITEYKEI